MEAALPSTEKWTLESYTFPGSWHYRLNRLARKAHPNLFETIEHIKNEQASTEVQIIQVAAGGQPRPKKKKLLDKMSKSKDLLPSLAVDKEHWEHWIYFFQH